MADPRLYEQDAFVFLDAGQPEELLSPHEIIEKLKAIIASHPNELPDDVLRQSSLEQQAQYLLETYCELSLDSNRYIQWFAVRLEK